MGYFHINILDHTRVLRLFLHFWPQSLPRLEKSGRILDQEVHSFWEYFATNYGSTLEKRYV